MKIRLFLIAGLICMFCWPVSQAQSAEGKSGSKFMSLGDPMPEFQLPDVRTGKMVSSDDFKDKKAVLLMVICRHCPYVQHIKSELGDLGRDYAAKDIALVAISANDPKGYPNDHPDKLKEMADEEGYGFPFLFDEPQDYAKALTAAATPEFFLFDEERKLIYRGQFDDSRPGSRVSVTGKDLRAAMDAVLAGQPVNPDQKRAVGCSIKWKKGNNPFSPLL